MDTESPETCPRLIPRIAIRRRSFPHPVLRIASGYFPRTLHWREVVHLEERMANRNRQFARARDDWDRGSTEHFIRRICSQLLQSLPSPIRYAFFFWLYSCTIYFTDAQWFAMCCTTISSLVGYVNITSNTIRSTLREAASYHGSRKHRCPAGATSLQSDGRIQFTVEHREYSKTRSRMTKLHHFWCMHCPLVISVGVMRDIGDGDSAMIP